jgi:hypothetical protein
MIIETYEGKKHKWNLRFEYLEAMKNLAQELGIPLNIIRK